MKLRQLSRKELQEILPQEDFAPVDKDKEGVFSAETDKSDISSDPLISVEVALRKCERVGVFRK